MLSSRFMMKWRQGYSICLTHDKLSAGCSARLMKMFLERVSSGKIFSDADHLDSTAELFGQVKQSAHVVFILSDMSLARPTCVGQVTTAHLNTIPIVPVVLTASAPAPKKTGLAPEQLTEISRALVPFGFKQEDVQTSINSILSVQPIANSSSTGAVAEILAWLKTSSGRKSGVSRVSSHTDALASLSESTDLAIKPRVTVLAGAEDGEAASAAIYCRLMLQKRSSAGSAGLCGSQHLREQCGCIAIGYGGCLPLHLRVLPQPDVSCAACHCVHHKGSVPDCHGVQ
jgi:hypothetical protein